MNRRARAAVPAFLALLVGCSSGGGKDGGGSGRDAAAADDANPADLGAPSDAGTPDSGAASLDAWPSDAEAADTLAEDAVPADAAADDASPSDTAPGDAPGAADATPDATIVVDAGLDAGSADTGSPCPSSRGSMRTALTGRIFGADSFGPATVTVYDVTTGTSATPRAFANVAANGWLGPMLITNDAHFFVVTNLMGGSLFEISAGGTFTSTRGVVASNLFASVSFPEGLARDDRGRFYVSNGDTGLQPIAVVTSTGSISQLPRMYDDATSLLYCAPHLLIAEANAGNVLLHNVETHTETVFASGFRRATTHISAEMVVDRRGHIIVLWSTPTSQVGLFDISAGGDFTTATPLATAPFPIDVNQISVDDRNDIYAAGATTGSMYVARFNGNGYAPFVVFASGLGDNESSAVGP
jgi:hypothetical protein